MLLEARNLHIGYGDAPAVWDVSLDVDGGEIVSVIGPNGAGKTTLINAIAGMLRCRPGTLRFDGADMTAVSAHDYCGHGIALVPEGRRLFAKMSVEENLELGCYLRPPGRAGRVARAGLRPVPDPARQAPPAGRRAVGRPAADGGDRRALMARPRIVLFDEPSLGPGADHRRRHVRDHRARARRGRRVCWSSRTC
jgi:branched-chain amino acid transport system ATP-binding protein